MPELPSVESLLAEAVEALGGTQRPGQVEMALAVERAIRTGEHLAVQAGTGTGKSLGYLVPAVRHAVAEDATVVVSTATIALQPSRRSPLIPPNSQVMKSVKPVTLTRPN